MEFQCKTYKLELCEKLHADILECNFLHFQSVISKKQFRHVGGGAIYERNFCAKKIKIEDRQCLYTETLVL